jgi:hypothetical protein
MSHRKDHALKPLHRQTYKRRNHPGRINWLHTTLKRRHQLPKDWQLTQCLFGEHLLPQHPDKAVALVESEKTAIICAAHIDLADWLIEFLEGKVMLSK